MCMEFMTVNHQLQLAPYIILTHSRVKARLYERGVKINMYVLVCTCWGGGWGGGRGAVHEFGFMRTF